MNRTNKINSKVAEEKALEKDLNAAIV